MGGAIRLLPLYAFMAWTGTTIYLYLFVETVGAFIATTKHFRMSCKSDDNSVGIVLIK
jgi:hypothetical protein